MLDETRLTHRRKADFSEIYVAADPRPYFRTLATLDYQIPLRALPVFEAALDATNERFRERVVLDVCCSYGINSALLYSAYPDRTAQRYLSSREDALTTAELAAADARHYRHRRRDVTVLGLDASAPAIDYGRRSGLLSAGWAENLEDNDPSPELRAGIADVDMIWCTGGIGYVGERTFAKLLDAIPRPERLWLICFVLRVFDYRPLAGLFAQHGLVTETLPGTFPQRRFRDAAEREAAMADLRQRHLDPDGLESAGWFHTQCFVTRPRAVADRVPVAELAPAAAARRTA